MINTICRAVLLSALVLMPFCVYSQQNDTLASAVVVSQSKADASLNAKFAPGTRVERYAKIQHVTAGNSLSDFLQRETALYVKEYGRGMSSYLAIRGTSSTHTSIDWNGQSLLVPTLGQADLSHIPTYFFDNMTIHVGGNSALYGNGSMGGSIQLRTAPKFEKGADGVTDIYGVMFLPNDFEKGKKYPVTEYYYGGNQTTRAPKTFEETQDTLGFTPCFSAMGFITVIIDGRGTPLRTKDFHHYCYNNMGDCAGLEDHVAVIKALCKRYDFIDPERIGVWGHSGGGFATFHCLIDHPEIYKAGVSTGGNHSQEIYSAEWSERYMGAFKRELWEKQNAEYHAERLEGKLLLMHGELDDNVHPASTLRVVDALIKADKDFDLLIMPGRHHTMRDSDYYRRRVLEYFAKNL